MPKLKTTIDNLELKSNKVRDTIPRSEWTDEQYPSAKTLYNTYTEINTNIENNLEHTDNKVVGTAASSSWTDTQYPSAKTLYNISSAINTDITNINKDVESINATIAEVESDITDINNTAELKSNRVLGTYPSIDWTDEQYPSAKTLYNVAQYAKGKAHPMQALLTTYNTQPPESFVGIGTWELVDKEFAYSEVCLAELTGNIWTPNSADTGAAIDLDLSYLTRTGKFIYLDLRLKTKSILYDSQTLLGSLDPTAIGLASMTGVTVLNKYSNVAFSDNGQYQAKIMASSGMYGRLSITSMSGLDLTSGNFQIPADTDIDVQIVLLASPDAMLNNYCDKFHWKRTT